MVALREDGGSGAKGDDRLTITRKKKKQSNVQRRREFTQGRVILLLLFISITLFQKQNIK